MSAETAVAAAAFLGSIAAFVFQIGKRDARLDKQEESLDDHEERVRTVESRLETLAVLDERTERMQGDIADIREMLERRERGR